MIALVGVREDPDRLIIVSRFVRDWRHWRWLGALILLSFAPLAVVGAYVGELGPAAYDEREDIAFGFAMEFLPIAGAALYGLFRVSGLRRLRLVIDPAEGTLELTDVHWLRLRTRRWPLGSVESIEVERCESEGFRLVFAIADEPPVFFPSKPNVAWGSVRAFEPTTLAIRRLLRSAARQP